MQIVKKKLHELKPLEKNVRRHGEVQIEHFMESLRQFGQTRAFVVDEELNILVGNGMFEAMSKLEWKKPVFCHMVKGLTELEKKKLVLSDNKIFQLATDNFEVIDEMLQEIVEAGDLNIAGYSADILEDLVRGAGDVLEDMSGYGALEKEEIQEKAAQQPAEKEEEYVAGPPEGFDLICPHCGTRLKMAGDGALEKAD